MAEGSIVSGFQFISYKIDRIDFEVVPRVGVLQNQIILPPEAIDMGIQIRKTQCFRSEMLYICGLNIKMDLYLNEKLEEEERLATGKFGIAGLFKLIDPDSIDLNMADRFAKVHGPALLLPYLRAFISSTLAHAGFGNPVFPLINMQKIGEQQVLKDEIIILDDQKST